MKVAIASILAIIALSEGFVHRDGYGRSGTQLYKYRPTKWTPQGGAAPPGATKVSPPAPQVAAGPSMANLAKEWAAVQSAPQASSVKSAASGPKKSYSVSRWSPQTGSRPMTTDGSGRWTSPDVVVAPATSMAAPAAAAAPVAPKVAFASGPKKSYSVTRWSPATGSRPMTIDASGSWTAPAGSETSQSTFSAAPVVASVATPAAPAATSAPKTSYSVSRWGPKTGSRPMTIDASGSWTPPNGSVLTSSMASPAVAAAAPAPAAVAPASVATSGHKKSFGVSRWSPETGSRPMTIDSSGRWTPPAGAGSSVSAVAAAPVFAAPAPAQVIPKVSGPKTSFSATRWSPQTGSRPMTIDASGRWTPPAGAVSSSSSPAVAAPAPASPSMNSVAKEWSAVNKVSTAAPAPARAAPSAPKKSFSVSRWSPQTGSRPMTKDASGSWTSAGVGAAAPVSSMAAKAAPAPVAAAPVAASVPAPKYGSTVSSAATSKSSAGPKNMYSVSKWSPRASSAPNGSSANGARGVNGVNGASVNGAAPKVAAAPASRTIKSLAAEWAAMNRV